MMHRPELIAKTFVARLTASSRARAGLAALPGAVPAGSPARLPAFYPDTETLGRGQPRRRPGAQRRFRMVRQCHRGSDAGRAGRPALPVGIVAVACVTAKMTLTGDPSSGFGPVGVNSRQIEQTDLPVVSRCGSCSEASALRGMPTLRPGNLWHKPAKFQGVPAHAGGDNPTGLALVEHVLDHALLGLGDGAGAADSNIIQRHPIRVLRFSHVGSPNLVATSGGRGLIRAVACAAARWHELLHTPIFLHSLTLSQPIALTTLENRGLDRAIALSARGAFFVSSENFSPSGQGGRHGSL